MRDKRPKAKRHNGINININDGEEQQWESNPNIDTSTSTQNINVNTPEFPTSLFTPSSESSPDPYETIPVPIPPQSPDPADIRWWTTWVWTHTSTGLTDVSCFTTTTAPEDSNPDGDNDVEDLQSTLSGNTPIITYYWDPTETDPVHLDVDASQFMSLSPILATSGDSVSSQLALSSFFFSPTTFPLTPSFSPFFTAHPSQPHFATPSPTRTAAPVYSSRALASSSATISTSSTSPASALPHIEHKDGAMSSDTVRTIVGVTIGGVAFLILVVFAIFTYSRRATARDPYPSMRFPSPLPKRNEHASSTAEIQSLENTLRREHETFQIHARDLERARTVSSGSHYSDYDEDDVGNDLDENWHEIDVRDARSGKMQRDNGEWLESWRRGKERMITMREAPELHSNPDLPLPPLNWDGEKRKFCLVF